MNSLKIMTDVLELEAQSLLSVKKSLREDDVKKLLVLYDDLIQNHGSLVFSGVGKSGIIAKKCAATFSSLGLKSFFLHPIEALHGDLGLLTDCDGIVFISKSGTTEEILKLIPFISVPKEKRIGLIGAAHSPIGDEVGIVFDVSVEKEACLNNQAPTTSSTAALAMGDAMAVLWEAHIGLSRENFAYNHPGGILGKSLRIKVKDLAIDLSRCPTLKLEDTLEDVILQMTKFPVGGAIVVNDRNEFLGIVVEGDIRRTLLKSQDGSKSGLKTPVKDFYNQNPITVKHDCLAIDALMLMENSSKSITMLPVLDASNEKIVYGFIRLQELIKEGFVLN